MTTQSRKVQCLCERWYDLDTRPDRCECGQRLRLTPEEAPACALCETETGDPTEVCPDPLREGANPP